MLSKESLYAHCKHDLRQEFFQCFWTGPILSPSRRPGHPLEMPPTPHSWAVSLVLGDWASRSLPRSRVAPPRVKARFCPDGSGDEAARYRPHEPRRRKHDFACGGQFLPQVGDGVDSVVAGIDVKGGKKVYHQLTEKGARGVLYRPCSNHTLSYPG